MNRPAPHAEAEKFFDRIAEDYRQRSEGEVYNTGSLSFRRRRDIVQRIIDGTPSGGAVLDYGMGPGLFTRYSTERGCHFVGIDISARMIELAEARQIANAEYHQGDIDILSRFAGTADLVLLIGLIDYLVDPPGALRELGACVRPGGRLAVSFRNHRSLPRLLRNVSKDVWKRLRRRQRTDGEGLDTAFEAPVLERSYVPGRDLVPVLRECGFGSFQIRYLDCSPIFFQVPLPKPLWRAGVRIDELVSGWATSFMCASGVLVARKEG